MCEKLVEFGESWEISPKLTDERFIYQSVECVYRSVQLTSHTHTCVWE